MRCFVWFGWVARLVGAGCVLCCGVLLVLASVSLAAGDVNEAACPAATEAAAGFRAGLPDCRAYELVSPASTNGDPLGEEEVSADGQAVGFSSIGEFAEAGDDENTNGALYVARRGASGWSSVSMEPSAEAFQTEFPHVNEENRGYSGDLREALFTLVPGGASPPDFRYYRRGQDGSFGEVGPTVSAAGLEVWTPAEGTPPILWLGATPDLSHVFFTPQNLGAGAKHWFWPGDATLGEYSLYEYAGTGSEPVLVGVKPGPGEAVDRPAENPAVISQCGAALGGVQVSGNTRFLDTYNAVSSVPRSEQGRVVFFTAFACAGAPVVSEVYARVGGSRTVAVSQPSTGPAGDCEVCDESEPRPAVFQGANEEGSKVFFLSEEKLFGGVEGEAGENLYEYDFDAENQHERVSLVAPQMGGVMRVSEDGSRVYFVSGAVLAGSEPNEYGASAQPAADNLYVFDTSTRRVRFIAALSASDSQEWGLLDSRGSVGVTPDGRFLLFASVNDVTPDASGGARQLYRYDAGLTAGEEAAGVPRLVRVSVGDAASENGNNSISSEVPTQFYVNRTKPVPQPVSISSDGSRVFFVSGGALTAGALDHACAGEAEGQCFGAEEMNVYEYEAGRVYLLSDGRDTHAVFRGSAVTLNGASPSGSDVYFTSDDALAGQLGGETGEGYIYDARVSGGFAAPVSPAGCTGECQGPGSVPPLFGLPASMTLNGPGNPPPPPPPRSKTAAQVRLEKLKRALRACRVKHNRHKRSVCEAQARGRYGSSAKKLSGKKSLGARRGGGR